MKEVKAFQTLPSELTYPLVFSPAVCRSGETVKYTVKFTKTSTNFELVDVHNKDVF